jgi:hypothetical protein
MKRPETLLDVRRGHIIGKVYPLTQEAMTWLRDALDIALEELLRGNKTDKNNTK